MVAEGDVRAFERRLGEVAVAFDHHGVVALGDDVLFQVAFIRCPLLRRVQPVHAEVVLRIGPHGPGPEIRLLRQQSQPVDGELVRVLLQRLTFGKFEQLARHLHALAATADQVHLNALQWCVVKRMVGELLQPEARGKLAVGTRQQVQVEGPR